MGNKTSFKPGKEHWNWKGGKIIDTCGYMQILIDGKYIREHVYIIEKSIGRKLEYNEVVHHVDSDRLNNSIDNLQLMTRSEHCRLHASGTYPSEETRKKFREIRAGTNQKEKHPQWKSAVTKELIIEALGKFNKRKDAAEYLGIHVDTLRFRINYYNLTKEELNGWNK